MAKKLYVPAESTNYLSLNDAVSVFNMSATTIKKLAKACNAKLKIGSLARYRRDVLEAYINSLMEEKGA